MRAWDRERERVGGGAEATVTGLGRSGDMPWAMVPWRRVRRGVQDGIGMGARRLAGGSDLVYSNGLSTNLRVIFIFINFYRYYT